MLRAKLHSRLKTAVDATDSTFKAMVPKSGYIVRADCNSPIMDDDNWFLVYAEDEGFFLFACKRQGYVAEMEPCTDEEALRVLHSSEATDEPFEEYVMAQARCQNQVRRILAKRYLDSKRERKVFVPLKGHEVAELPEGWKSRDIAPAPELKCGGCGRCVECDANAAKPETKKYEFAAAMDDMDNAEQQEIMSRPAPKQSWASDEKQTEAREFAKDVRSALGGPAHDQRELEATKPETEKYVFVTRIRVDLSIEVEAESEEDARKQAERLLDEEVTDTAMGGFGFVGTNWTTRAHHIYNIASKGPAR